MADYNSWESNLFEELHPSAKITHGDIKLVPPLLVVSWGDYTTSIPAAEFYEHESINPLYDIKKWSYESLPFIEAENPNTYIVYNTVKASYEAHTLRSMGTKRVTSNVSPEDYQNYGNYGAIAPFISTEMNGTVVCFSSNDNRIPASLAISEPEVFKTLIEEHMDYTDDLRILVPEQSSHVFVGCSTAIDRLQENFARGTTLNTTTQKWFKNITKNKG